MSVTEISIIALAGFMSGIIKNGVGVGAGIFLLPTLSLVFPAKTALGIGAPLMLASDIIGLRYYWRQWAEKQEILRLLLSAAPGLLIGTLLLPVIPAKTFRLCVGIFGMLYALCGLWPALSPGPGLRKALHSTVWATPERSVYFYGALGGAATILAHAGGIVWSLYLMNRLHDKRIFVGTIVLTFFLTNIYKMFAYIWIDTLSVDTLISILPTLPAVWLGSAVGNSANRKMNQELFRKLVFAVIFMVSVDLSLQ